MYIATDLHGHTFFSDGRDSPERYVDFRREQKISAIAISDHDVLTGVERGAVAAAAASILFIPAVEVTSFLHFGTDRAEQFHVLAYYPAALAAGQRIRGTALYQRGLKVQRRWRDFVLAWMADLPADDRLALDPEADLAGLEPAAFPALQSMIDRIIEKRRSLFEAFREHHRYFWERDNKELFGWEPEEAIEAIRADGAVDIIAHPVRYRDKERAEKILSHATGIEVYTSRHKPEVAAAYRTFAEERGLLWTASSDDHQNARYVRPPVGTPVLTLERILCTTLPMNLILAA